MSALINIPFNNQPVNNAVTTGNYTVPAGKYAKVYIGNTLLPVLNGVAMYTSINMMPDSGLNFTTSGLYCPLRPVKNVHSFSVQKDGGSNAILFSVIDSPLNTGFTTYQFNLSGSSASRTILLTPNSSFSWIQGASTTGGTGFISFSANYYNGPKELWLKSGSIFTHSGGTVSYEEYTNIS